MTKTAQRMIAGRLTVVSFWSWVLFVVIELVLPSSVMRIFSPHWFLLAFVIGALWWYYLLKRG